MYIIFRINKSTFIFFFNISFFFVNRTPFIIWWIFTKLSITDSFELSSKLFSFLFPFSSSINYDLFKFIISLIFSPFFWIKSYFCNFLGGNSNIDLIIFLVFSINNFSSNFNGIFDAISIILFFILNIYEYFFFLLKIVHFSVRLFLYKCILFFYL